MNNIFVTGINGLLGTNLCNNLLDHNFKVKGLIRDKTKFEGVKHHNLELIQGDLFDDFTSILQNIDCIVHIAAITDQNLNNYSPYWKINYNATMQLFHTAIKAKVKRFIFVSTANTIGYGNLNDLGSELNGIKSPFKFSFYAMSKLEAEQQLLQNKKKIDTIIINPTFMLGAFDTKPSSGKIILMSWKKKILFYPPGGKNFVHVRDVSNGIINSIHKGISGEKYLLANENITYLDFFKKINTYTYQSPIMIKVPKIILLIMGYLGDLLRLFNFKTNLSTINMKALCIQNYYSNKKSIKHLDLNYQPIENAIADAIQYFSSTKKR